ncbi:hypothetical protein Sros01_79660 [Streptomyces roseochromogenus]|nr:hypothetical protein Sros01_79660 [Streptomyces roseochromogenus]
MFWTDVIPSPPPVHMRRQTKEMNTPCVRDNPSSRREAEVLVEGDGLTRSLEVVRAAAPSEQSCLKARADVRNGECIRSASRGRGNLAQHARILPPGAASAVFWAQSCTTVGDGGQC